MTLTSGNVTDGSGHSWPLYARIDVAGKPGGPDFTDPITGHYSIKLPANASYDVTFTSQLTGYQAVHDTVAVGGTDLTHNVAMPVTPDCTAPGYALDLALEQRLPGAAVVVAAQHTRTGRVDAAADPDQLSGHRAGAHLLP